MTMLTLRRRPAALAAGLLSAALALTACGGDPDGATADGIGGEPTADTVGETRIFEADNGDIEIPVDPQRIVALSNAAGPVINLGVEPVGVTESVFFEDSTTWFSAEEVAAYESAEKVGSQEVDLEAIAGLEPDLIVISVPQGPWEQNYSQIEDRLQSIAPTVFIQNNQEEWMTVERRQADAVGASGVYEALAQEYDALFEEMKEEFASEIESLTFTALTRYANTDEGQVIMHSAGTYMAVHPTAVGFDFGECSTCELSMEQLSGLADHDVIIYPLGPDGEPTVDFAPVIDSNVWNSLPQVVDGRALGVEYPTSVLSVNTGIVMLTSLGESLRTLPEVE